MDMAKDRKMRVSDSITQIFPQISRFPALIEVKCEVGMGQLWEAPAKVPNLNKTRSRDRNSWVPTTKYSFWTILSNEIKFRFNVVIILD